MPDQFGLTCFLLDSIFQIVKHKLPSHFQPLPFCRRPAPGAVLPVRVLQDEELPARRGGGEGERGRVRTQQLRPAEEVCLGAI